MSIETDKNNFTHKQLKIKTMTTKTKLPIGLMLILSLIAVIAVSQIARLFFLFYYWGLGTLISSIPIFEILESVMFLGLSIYTIVSFIKRKSNAVFLGKLFFGLLLLRSFLYPIVFSLIATIPVLVGRGGQAHWFHWVAIPLYLIGLAYLLFSKQIQNFFPKEQRTIRKIDMAIAIVAVPIVVLGVFYFRDLFGFPFWYDFFVLGIR
jgi:hypothetical protein